MNKIVKFQLSMKQVIAFAISVLIIFPCIAQKIPADRTAKAIFVEGLGSGVGLSINFDTRFRPGRLDGLGMRAGVGGLSVSRVQENGLSANTGFVSLPVLLNYVVGNSRAAFEAGAGVTGVYANESGFDAAGGYSSEKGIGAFGTFNFGLRLQPKRTGAHFRLYWSPIVSVAGFQTLWLGFSIGVGFK
jgi:hypothetical protein